MLAPDTILQSRYRITRQLGQGGMGMVYEAKALRLNTTVALKETHFTDERLRKQFQREAQLLAGLRHPALPRVIDHFDEGDGLYLVMDFIEGDDLWEMLGKRGEPFPIEEVLTWADQLLDALTYLHTQEPPVVHRDIKPQNLKLTKGGQIILLDFGLAKGFAGLISKVTTTGSIFGYTPNYAPLEQIKGTGTEPRSDLYSLAATLYHLMTGLIPPDALSRATAKVDDEPDPLRPADEVNPGVSREVAEVLQRAVAQSPGKRFATAAQMREALREASEAVKAKNSQAETVLLPPPTIGSHPPIENFQEHEAEPLPLPIAETAKEPEEKEPYSTLASPTITPPAVPPPPSAFAQQQLQPVWWQAQPARQAQKSSLKLWIIGGLVALGIALIAVVFYVRFKNSISDAGAGNHSDVLRSLEPSKRGKILDRSGRTDPNSLLAFNQQDVNGKTERVYPMGAGLAHLLGTERGEPGLDRALYDVNSDGKDVRLTISRELQQAAVEELKGKRGAVVILNPQTGEVLAMYSNPSYEPQDLTEETRKLLEADQQNRPLVNRALNSYYIPGSTFETFMLIAAHRAGVEDTQFVCSGNGFLAMPGAKPIFDDGGPGEVHGLLGIDRAYEVSCNQYFAQMAVKLGSERIKETAKLVGVGAYDTAEETTRGRKLLEIWNASSEAIKRVLAPREATLLAGTLDAKFNKFDLALEGYGQGYAGQMTPFQMALLASAIGNIEGKLMKLKIEYDRPLEVFNQVMTPQVAQRLRGIMGLVTGGPEGTARGVFAQVKAAGINTGGKTGTAQKILPLLDKNGKVVTRQVYDKDPKGNIIGQHTETVLNLEHPRVDSWFLCIAPLERPQVAMAVIVEGGGYGSKTAAPIAARLVLKARELGLLGRPLTTS